MRHQTPVAPLAASLLSLATLLATCAISMPSVERDLTCKYPNSTYYGRDTLRVIWKPLATIPEFVRPGDTLTVWANAPAVPTNWSAMLGFGALSVPLVPALSSFRSDLGWWV